MTKLEKARIHFLFRLMGKFEYVAGAKGVTNFDKQGVDIRTFKPINVYANEETNKLFIFFVSGYSFADRGGDN
jgi:hypothetical protein